MAADAAGQHRLQRRYGHLADNGVREVELAYKLDINEFRGNRTLQIIIDNIWPICWRR